MKAVLGKIERASAEGIDLGLRTTGDRILVLPDVTLAMRLDHGAIRGMVVEVAVPFAVWAEIDGRQLFHSEPSTRGAFHEGRFDAGADVELELGLATDLVDDMPRRGAVDGPSAIGALMRIARDADPAEPVLDGDNWYLLRAAQVRGAGVKTGFATTWARAERLP